MKKLLSLLLVLAIFVGLLAATALPAAAAELPFTDVKTGHPFYEGVKYVYENGIMNGTAADRFSPGDSLTRAMIVTILYRMEGSPKGAAPDFTDVPAGTWYTDSVGWAASNGVVNGVGSGKFAPNDALTREQLVTILYRYCKSPAASGELKFPDAKRISDWAVDPMRWAVDHGMISAMKNGSISPKATAVRSLVATMLKQLHDVDVNTPSGLTVANEHKVVEDADYSALERLYAGKQITYAGLHEHSDSGKVSRDGKMVGSDGKFTLKQWKTELMPELGYDVVAIVDHRQVQGFYSEDWDSDLFICGSEPSTHITDLSIKATTKAFHYAMLFDDKDDLEKVVSHFTEFEFRGDSPDPHYWGFTYPNFTKARFQELVDYVRSLGGIISYSHPVGSADDSATYMSSENIEDYFRGEFTYFDIFVSAGAYTVASQKAYGLWQQLLQAGHHVYATAIGDTHSKKTCDPCAFYTADKKAAQVFDLVKAGNFTSGFMGIKMNIGDHPMGSVAGYKAGDILTVEAADLFGKHPDIKPDGNFYLRVFTEDGLCACKKLDANGKTRLALTVQDKAYYRADVYNVDNNCAIAVSNPIWKN